MATCSRLILILVLTGLLTSGCYEPGGGGSVHVPPESVAYGQPMPLRLELSVWGAGAGKMTERYTEIRCHYKAEKGTAFTALEGKVESEAKDRLFVVFELPAFSAADGAYIEYYFGEKLDGHYNKRPVERVPLR
jgi:hypothetical protein